MTGLQVRELRESMGLSRMEMALKLGVSYFTVAKWEGGHTHPSPMAQKQIERLLAEKNADDR